MKWFLHKVQVSNSCKHSRKAINIYLDSCNHQKFYHHHAFLADSTKNLGYLMIFIIHASNQNHFVFFLNSQLPLINITDSSQKDSQYGTL